MTSTDPNPGVFTLGIAAQDGIVDDGRRWWYIGAKSWPSIHPVAAVNGRMALAQFRRDIIAAELFNGESRRAAIDYVRAVGLYVIDGPLTTSQAYECEVGWAWAWALCKFTADVPLNHATEAILQPHVSAEQAARLRAQVRTLFLKEDTR
jgi:hypothetical protein